MPDNVGYTAGTGTNIATDEIGGVHYQRVKLAAGINGVARDVSESDPLPTQEVGGATSLLMRIFNILASPMGYDRALARNRVSAVVESGTVTTVSTVTTVTTVTTVSTVTGLTNIDGTQGRLLVNGANFSAWANCVRARIT